MNSSKSSQSRASRDLDTLMEVASGMSNSSQLSSIVHGSYVYKRDDRLESRKIQMRHVGCRDVPRTAMIHQTTFTVLSPSASQITQILSSGDYPLGLVGHRKPFKKSVERKYPSLVSLIFTDEEIKRLEGIFWSSKKGIPYLLSFENELREFLKAQAYCRKRKGTLYSFADALPIQPKPRPTLDDIRFPKKQSIKPRASKFWLDQRASLPMEEKVVKNRRKTKKDAFEVYVDTSFTDAKLLDAKILDTKLLEVLAGEKDEELVSRPSVTWSGRSVPEFKLSRRKDSRKSKQRKRSLPENKKQKADSSHTIITSSKVSLMDVTDRTIQIPQLGLKESEFEEAILVKKGKKSKKQSMLHEGEPETSSSDGGSGSTPDDDQSVIDDTDLKMKEFLDDEDVEIDQHRASYDEITPEFVQSSSKIQKKPVKKKSKKHAKKSIRPATGTSSISIKQKESEVVISAVSSGKLSTQLSTPHEPEAIPDDDSSLDEQADRADYDSETLRKLRRNAEKGMRGQSEEVESDEATSTRVAKTLLRMRKAAQRVDTMQAVTAESNMDLLKKQEKQEVTKCYVGRWDDEAKSNVFQDLIHRIEKREAPLKRDLEEGVARVTKPSDAKRPSEEYSKDPDSDNITKPDTTQRRDSSKRTTASTEDGYDETRPVDKDREERRKHASREHVDDLKSAKRLTDMSDTSLVSTHLGAEGRDGGMGVQLKGEQLTAAELMSLEKGIFLVKHDGAWTLVEDCQKDAERRAKEMGVDYSVRHPEINVERVQGALIQELRSDEYVTTTRGLLTPGRHVRDDTLWSPDEYGDIVDGEGTPLRRSLVDDGAPTRRRYHDLEDATGRLSDGSMRSRLPSTISDLETTATSGSASTYHTQDGQDEAGFLVPSEDPSVTLGKLVAKLMGRLDKEKSSTRKFKHAAKMDFQMKMQEFEKSQKRMKSVTYGDLKQKDMVKDARGRLKKGPSSVEVHDNKGKERKESGRKSSRRVKTRADSEHAADERDLFRKTEWEDADVEERKRWQKKKWEDMDDEERRQVKSGGKRKDTKGQKSMKLAVGRKDGEKGEKEGEQDVKEREQGEEDGQLEALMRESIDVEEMLASEETYSSQSAESGASVLTAEDAQRRLSHEHKQMKANRLRERTRASDMVKAMPREILGLRSLLKNPLEQSDTIMDVQSQSSLTSKFGSRITRSSSMSYSEDNLSTATSSIDQGSAFSSVMDITVNRKLQGRFHRKGIRHSISATIDEIAHPIGKSDSRLAIQRTEGKTVYRPEGYIEEFRRVSAGAERRGSVTEEEYLGRKIKSSSATEFYEFGQPKEPSSATEFFDFDVKKQPLSDTDDDFVPLKVTPSEIERKKIIKKARKTSTYNKIKIAEMKKVTLPEIQAVPRIPLPSPFTGWDFDRPVEPRDFTEFPEIIDAIPQLIRLSISREERLTLPEIGVHHQNYIHKTAPHTEGDSYLLEYGIVELLEYMMFNLIMRKPDQPIDFLVDLTRTIMRQMKARYEMAQLLESASASCDADKASYSTFLESSPGDSQISLDTKRYSHLKT